MRRIGRADYNLFKIKGVTQLNKHRVQNNEKVVNVEVTH